MGAEVAEPVSDWRTPWKTPEILERVGGPPPEPVARMSCASRLSGVERLRVHAKVGGLGQCLECRAQIPRGDPR